MKKSPFRLTPYQVQFLLVVGFVTVGYALYLRYLAVELSTVALACDAGLQTMLCKARTLATYLFKNSVFGIAALIIATLHVMRPSIVLLTGGLIAAGFGIVLYNIVLSGIAIGLLILGFARPAPATA
jgi:prepilin signal peptidase PulO-like enzyme (type II secretory pathway)